MSKKIGKEKSIFKVDTALAEKAKTVLREVRNLLSSEKSVLKRTSDVFNRRLKAAMLKLNTTPQQRYLLMRSAGLEASAVYALVRRLGKKVIASPYKARGNSKTAYKPSGRQVRAITASAMAEVRGDRKRAKILLYAAYRSM